MDTELGGPSEPPSQRNHTHPIGLWLAEAHPAPAGPWLDWRRGGSIAVLATGERFDAVRMPGDLVHAAVGATDHATVSGALAAALAGPVICDTRWYYALVPPRTSERWTCGLARCLSTGAWLTVPRPDRTDDTGTGIHWCVPMAYPGRLCDSAAVDQLLQDGHERLTPAPCEFRRPAS
ncbi:hypothetical protein [Streptomyces sp. NPDC001889]